MTAEVTRAGSARYRGRWLGAFEERRFSGVGPVIPRHVFPDVKCAWCRCYPCVCRRSAPCCCGGAVIVGNDPATSMRIHQATPKHGAWRRELGL